MILGITIQTRIEKELGRSIVYDFDIRYLQRWINQFPKIFPRFIHNNNYTSYYNPEKMRWEIKATNK